MMRAHKLVRATPNAVIDSAASRMVRLWSETHLGIGTTTTTSASVGDVSTWGVIRCTRTPGFPDPDGGNGAVKITENISGSNESHYIYGPLVNGGGIWLDYPLWITSLPGGRDWHLLFAPGSEVGIWFNATTGVVGQNYPLGGTAVTATVTPDGGGFWVTLKVRGGTGIATQIRVYPANGDGTFTYAGDGRDTSLVYRATVTQIRASAQNNLARADDGSLIDAVGGVQTTIANQPLILDQNGNFYTGASGQIPVAAREAGRASFLAYTDPDILAVFDGDNPPLWCCGIAKGTLGYWLPVQANGAGIVRDCPLEIYSANLYSIRDDGVSGNGAVLLEANGGTRFANWSTWAIIRLSNRVVEFWHQGAFINSVTLNAQATMSHASVTTGHPTSITPNQQQLALMVGSGQLPGATAAARYAQIRPALLAACARYPGLGLVA